MTYKFIGNITVEANSSDSKEISIKMPTDTTVPLKQEWHKYPVWQFNGKAYKPLTPLAEESLALAIQEIQKFGFSKAIKEGKRKPTSISYAILTTGVEPFYYI